MIIQEASCTADLNLTLHCSLFALCDSYCRIVVASFGLTLACFSAGSDSFVQLTAVLLTPLIKAVSWWADLNAPSCRLYSAENFKILVIVHTWILYCLAISLWLSWLHLYSLLVLLCSCIAVCDSYCSIFSCKNLFCSFALYALICCIFAGAAISVQYLFWHTWLYCTTVWKPAH